MSVVSGSIARRRFGVVAVAMLVACNGLAAATTYYVRSDGGSASECTGLADAAYSGSGSAQACAWDHPFRALPPGGPARLAGGDTLLIAAGSYQMGVGAPGADDPGSPCDADAAWDCYMVPIPSGPDAAHPTRVLGAGWASGCPDAPELWGSERSDMVLNLTDSSHVEIACLEITDHSGCVEFHTGALTCERDTPPFGDWAVRGIYAADSADVALRDLDVHGLAVTGIQAGRLSDWTVEDVRIVGNGWAGWDGDIEDTDSNSGDLVFRRLTVEWNGCGETYPGGEPAGCWGQSAGGYGDGLGTGATAGRWVFEDSVFRHNTSDGLDLLYGREGSSIEIRRTLAEGNAGNQIKTNGPALIESSIVVGNCDFFTGQPFTLDVDACRAAGNALSLTLRHGDLVQLLGSTITSQGDCLVLADCDIEQSSCDGSESLRIRNNLFVGHPDATSDDLTCLFYQETFPHDPFDDDYSLIVGVKDDACPGPHDLCGLDPGVVDDGIDSFDAHLEATSPAVDAGSASGTPDFDFDNRARDAQPDIGAYEYGAAGGCVLTCAASAPPAATVGSAVMFSATATATACVAAPAYDWDFGDASGHQAGTGPSHTYTAAGAFTWRVTVTADQASCTRSDTIVVTANPAPTADWIIPGVAHTPGVAGTLWRTDLAAVNRGEAVATVTLVYTPATGAVLSTTALLAPDGAVEWHNILESLLGVGPGASTSGTLAMTSSEPLVVTARTFNQSQAGTFGQYLPALAAADALATSQIGVLAQLKRNLSFRTNIGAVNLGDTAAEVVVRLYDEHGAPLGSPRTIAVAAGRWAQVNDVFRVVGAPDRDTAYATVEASGAEDLIWAYASVVDNLSGDPTTIPALVP